VSPEYFYNLFHLERYMEQFIGLLQYLEGVNPTAGFTVRGKIPARNSPLDYLNTIGTVRLIDFTVSFRTVADIQSIHADWLEETGAIFESMSWSGFIGRYQSTLQVYLNSPKKQMYIKSHNDDFIRRIEDFAHQYEYRLFNE